jgi:poly(3-hydroxybutyrate) depolymerase
VAAPDGLPMTGAGLGGTWVLHNRAGDGAGDVHGDVDDIAFIGLIAKCIAAFQVPLSNKLLLAGYSLGAKFACRVACAPPPGLHVVAVALAAGIQAEADADCAGPPVPTLLFQGGRDENVPFCTRARLGRFAYDPTVSHFAALAARNGARSMPEQLCSALGDGVMYSYRPPPGAANGTAAATVLFWMPGGGHVWPRAPLPGCVGDGTEVALAFFGAQLRGGAAAQQSPLPRAVCAAMTPCPQRAGPCERGSGGGDGTSTFR